MSLRQGVNPQEENRLKTLASQGKKWSEIVALSQPLDGQGNPVVPLLEGVDMEFVRKNIWEPLLVKHDEAVEAGFEDIHTHERALIKSRDEQKKKEKAAEEAGFDTVEDWEEAQDAKRAAREKKKKEVKGKGKVDSSLDDLLDAKPAAKKKP